jgi:crotonobetainyl-CoA:carnitine CoA-transferase CaiB-like acyl-CoA transferase
LRAQNQKDLVSLLQPEFEKETAKFWLDEMDIRGVPCSPINTFPEALNSDQIKSMDLVHPMTLPNNAKTKTTAFPIKMTDFDFEIYRSPPSLGAHNEEVADEWLKMPDGMAQ